MILRIRNRSALLLLCLAACMGGMEAHAANEFSLGVEGFYDNYQEPSGTVNTNTDYGSVTAGYMHSFNDFFTAVEGRYSQGNADYSADSTLGGTPEHVTINGITDIETDFRVRSGVIIPRTNGAIMPYVGVGFRYYFDEGKGAESNNGVLAYDRHISQIYIPVGGTYSFHWGDWMMAPNAEVDPMIWGQVNSHLAPLNAFVPADHQEPNISNTQHSGIGFRGEFMAGQQYEDYGWKIGPFFRYWVIQKSDVVGTPNSPPGEGLAEPRNTRLQAGLAFRVNF